MREKDLKEGKKFCQYCGAQNQIGLTVSLIKGGRKSNAIFCQKCGKKID